LSGLTRLVPTKDATAPETSSQPAYPHSSTCESISALSLTDVTRYFHAISMQPRLPGTPSSGPSIKSATCRATGRRAPGHEELRAAEFAAAPEFAAEWERLALTRRAAWLAIALITGPRV